MAELIHEVSFKGVASSTLRAAFDGFEVSAGSGVTLVRCSHDSLHSVIDRIEALGLELLDIRLVADRSAESRASSRSPGHHPGRGDDGAPPPPQASTI